MKYPLKAIYKTIQLIQMKMYFFRSSGIQISVWFTTKSEVKLTKLILKTTSYFDV